MVNHWGEDNYTASVDTIKDMTEEKFLHFKKLETEIIEILKEIRNNYDETLITKVAKLHQEWIKLAWGGNYTKEMHLGVVDFCFQDGSIYELTIIFFVNELIISFIEYYRIIWEITLIEVALFYKHKAAYGKRFKQKSIA